jgi:hypothetical protein
MTLHLVHHGQRDRLRAEEWAALDHRIHRMAMLDQAEREVARRMRRWRRRRWFKIPALWLAALIGAGLAWIAREKG